MGSRVSEKNGTVPCPKPKTFDVAQLTLITNPNTLNTNQASRVYVCVNRTPVDVLLTLLTRYYVFEARRGY